MKKIIFILLLVTFSLLSWAESIYDVQFTEDASGDSPYAGQIVTLTGIVTANNWNGDDIYISSPEGGAWNGIFIYSPTITAELGDEITITAEVAEYYGMTELTNITSMEVISSGNPVPSPVVITTAELASSEAYESVLVQVENVTTTVAPNNYGESYIDDGSGECQADDHMFEFVPAAGDQFAAITGIVAYAFDEYELNPRFADDVDFGGTQAFILGNVSINGGSGDLEEVVVSIDGFSTNPGASGDYVLEVPAGTWNVTAALNGYIPQTVYDITVEDGGTVTDVDFTLDVLPEATIYDIQFTEDPSGDSPFVDQEVTVTGIVTGFGFNNNNYFFMSTPEGGAWNGIYVYQFDYELAEGDEVTVTGTVSEYFGFTEIGNVSEITVNSSGNTLPAPVELTTAELASSEAYESVLCKVSDVTVTIEANENGEVYVSDGSGDCQIDDGFVSNPALTLGAEFNSITGIVDYSWDEFGLHPRYMDDFDSGTQPELVPIYDIQFTEDPSGDSPYIDQVVTVNGIVTGANFSGSKFFLSSPEGGAWNGVYVFQYDYEVAEGDDVTLTATVSEYYGFTELADITSLTVNSSGNTLPLPSIVTTAELASSEAYEGVLVTVENPEVTAEPNEYGEAYINDGSGDCQIDDGFYTYAGLTLGDTFDSITGIIDFSFDEYGLNPRDLDDYENGTQPEVVPIYDIQFTEDISGDSPYNDQVVTVNGIVTGANFSGSKFFLSSPEGGAWNGVYVYQFDYEVEEGDNVTLTATVTEYYGFTELGNVTSLTINSSGNTLPAPVEITTAELASSEAYEGVLVKILNAEVTAEINEFGEAYVNDGSGDCQTDDGFFAYTGFAIGQVFDSITGLVDYSFDEYGLHPRYLEDIEVEIQPAIVTIHDIQFTEDTSGDSPYADQLIQTTGTVYAAGYNQTNSFFMASSEGGAWNGIYVYQADYEVVNGDIVTVTGVVSEYYGFTEITSISDLIIESSGNPIPDPVVLTTADLAASEAYESVLVQVGNVEVTAEPNEYGEAYINDGTGDCQLDDGFVINPDIVLGAQFLSITGAVDYSFSEYAIHPRSLDDFVSGPQYIYGDVTGDEVVDAFDAANILQYAVGLDPAAAPLPWTWQLLAGDVDGNESVEAYDAALILQFSVGIISEFPVEARIIVPDADICLDYSNGSLLISGHDELYSALISIASDDVNLGNAMTHGDFLSAFNNQEKRYAVASAEIISGTFLTIPCEVINNNGSITLTATVNGISSEKTYKLADLTSGQIPQQNAVLGNYPNPFNPVTTIKLAVAENNSSVKVDIYNAKGQLIQTLYNGSMNMGVHNLTWNADSSSSASGVFFYKAQINSQTLTGKMIMLK